jgi:glutathione S-transferase
MDIYGSIYSPYTARVVIAARYKKLKHKLLKPKDGHKSPAFLKMNPFGKMPVLKDGGVTLFESGVIVEYLDAKYKTKRLIPTVPKAGAQARLIAAVVGEYLQPNIFAIWHQRDPAKRDQAIVNEKLAMLNAACDALEKMISPKPYATGAKLTIADCYAVPAFFWFLAVMPMIGIDKPLAGHKKLAKYVAAMKKDKLMSAVLAEMDAGLKEILSQA